MRYSSQGHETTKERMFGHLVAHQNISDKIKKKKKNVLKS